MSCLFCSIVAGEIPATILLQNDELLAFRDINPQAPTHVLVIPRSHYENAAELGHAEPASLVDLVATAHQVAEKEGLATT